MRQRGVGKWNGSSSSLTLSLAYRNVTIIQQRGRLRANKNGRKIPRRWKNRVEYKRRRYNGRNYDYVWWQYSKMLKSPGCFRFKKVQKRSLHILWLLLNTNQPAMSWPGCKLLLLYRLNSRVCCEIGFYLHSLSLFISQPYLLKQIEIYRHAIRLRTSEYCFSLEWSVRPGEKVEYRFFPFRQFRWQQAELLVSTNFPYWFTSCVIVLVYIH